MQACKQLVDQKQQSLVGRSITHLFEAYPLPEDSRQLAAQGANAQKTLKVMDIKGELLKLDKDKFEKVTGEVMDANSGNKFVGELVKILKSTEEEGEESDDYIEDFNDVLDLFK